MLKDYKECHCKLDLQMFADGASASGAADGGAAGQGAVQAEVAPPQSGRKPAGPKNPLSSVQYGKAVNESRESAPVAEEQKRDTKAEPKPKDPESPEDRERRFEELIRGEFADLYGKRMKAGIEDRLKSTHKAVEEYAVLKPAIEILAKKYGVDKMDVKALVKAIEEDDSFLEEESIETGTPTEQLRKIRAVTRENERLLEAERARKAEEESKAIYERLSEEARSVKELYPSFDLRVELKNPEFKKILGTGVRMQSAYEAIHAQELLSAAMSAAERDAEARVMNSVRVNGARPKENGNRSSSAAVRKTDVHTLTKADRAEIARRAQRGEKIVF